MTAARESDQLGLHRPVRVWQVAAVGGITVYAAHTLLGERFADELGFYPRVGRRVA
jgi:hypothetical protein